MVAARCEHCGDAFERRDPPRPGRDRFCSLTCKGLAQRLHPEVACEGCGKVFLPLGASARRFCSQECANARPQSDFPNWRGGVHQHSRGALRASLGGGRRELLHRVVAAREIGRPLGREEYVIPLDGNKLNVEPQNLYVVAGKGNLKRIELGLAPRPSESNLRALAQAAEGKEVPHAVSM